MTDDQLVQILRIAEEPSIRFAADRLEALAQRIAALKIKAGHDVENAEEFRRLAEKDAREVRLRIAALEAERDAAWTFIANSYDIEPHEYFEREAPKNGFTHPLVQAIHHIWKRDPKVQALEAEMIQRQQAVAALSEALQEALAALEQESLHARELARAIRQEVLSEAQASTPEGEAHAMNEALEVLIDGRCSCERCRARTEDVYRMVGVCRNCGTRALMLFRSGDKAAECDCPVCGNWHAVMVLRKATADDIPAEAERAR